MGDLEDLSSREPPIPELGDREKRREKKGAGLVLGQSGAAGVGTTNLVPGPLVQVGKLLLGVGGAAGAAQPSVLKAFGSFAVKGLLPVLALAALTAQAFVVLFRALGDSKSGAHPGQAYVFGSRLGRVDETGAIQQKEDTDSLAYFIAGNQGSGGMRSSFSSQSSVPGGGLSSSAPDDGQPSAKPQAGAPDPMAEAAKDAQDAVKQQAAAAAAAGATAPLEQALLAGGGGMAKGINRRFDPFWKFAPPPGRTGTAAMGAFSVQRSPYHSARHGAIGGRGVTGPMNQLLLSHDLSRQALKKGSSEGKAAEAANAFGKGPGTSQATVRPSGVGKPGQSMSAPDRGDGPLSTPYSGNNEAPSAGETGDVSPWTSDVDSARSKLQDASSLITVIGILAPFKMLPIVGPIVAMVQGMLYGMALNYSSQARDLGNSVQSNWAQPQQSDIVTTGSAITDAAAAAALAAPVSATAWASVLAGTAGIAALIGILLIPKK